MKTAFVTYAVTFVMATALFAQSRSVTLANVYAGADGLAHVVDATGKDTAFKKEKNQVAVSRLKLSPDKQTAGWQIERENCCTSYSIATRLAMYRAGANLILIADGQMIYDWCFVGEGTEVALSSGPTHGVTSLQLSLYDSRSGRVKQKWRGEPNETPPTWAKDLEQ